MAGSGSLVQGPGPVPELLTRGSGSEQFRRGSRRAPGAGAGRAHHGRRHRGRRPGDIPFGILSELADRVVTVSEERLARGLLLRLERAKQVMESAGAAGVAALFEHSREFVPRRW